MIVSRRARPFISAARQVFLPHRKPGFRPNGSRRRTPARRRSPVRRKKRWWSRRAPRP